MTDPDRSFTSAILAEVAPHIPPFEHCRLALVHGVAGSEKATVSVKRLVTARAVIGVLHADGIAAHVETEKRARGTYYRVEGAQARQADLSRACCKRAVLRGAFLASGSVRRADAPPHVELVTADHTAFDEWLEACGALEIKVTVGKRRGRYLVLVRTTAGVADFLSSIGAHQGRLRFEEARVLREVRASVNRKLNSETANLHRTVVAALGQIEAIRRLRESDRWRSLSPALREAAELRLQAPSEPLASLARQAGCSRSAMAGRLRRIVGSHSGTSGNGT